MFFVFVFTDDVYIPTCKFICKSSINAIFPYRKRELVLWYNYCNFFIFLIDYGFVDFGR